MFEEQNSILTKEQYAKLGFDLASAQSMDNNPNVNPLLGTSTYKSENGVSIRYNGEVEYGWSNPQVLSVMLSSPYWDELDYGLDMSAAGATKISVSSSVGEGSGTQSSVDFGVTVAAEGEVTAAGNGIVYGGGLEISSQKITEHTTEKTKEVAVELSCGANIDNAVVYVVPMATYKYEVTSNGVTDNTYVQVPLSAIFKVVSLDKYNSVAREVNMQSSSDDYVMTVIDMDNIYPNYKAGDPSTYFSKKEDFPTSFSIKNGEMIAMSGATDIKGNVYKSDVEYAISPASADTGGAITYSGSKSEGSTYSHGISMGGDLSVGLKAGVDVFGVTATTTVKVGVVAQGGRVSSTSTVNAKSISTSVEYIDLPSTATDVYSYDASQIVWVPTQVSGGVTGCPACIVASTVGIDGEYPLYMPDDLHVSSVDDNSVVLSWSNPNFGENPYRYRQPQSYNICMKSSGNVESYSVKKSISADNESVTVRGLESGKTYTFALQSVSQNSKSVIGPSVTITTSDSSLPVVTTQPTDACVELGQDAVFTVDAQPSKYNAKIEYQWQKLENNRYGSSFYDIENEKSNTLTIKVDESNASELNNTYYRCVIKQSDMSSGYNTVSDVVKLSVVYKIDDYDELLKVAQLINSGDCDYSKYDYVLTNDISMGKDKKWITPIGTKDHPFEGSFDGCGHTIDGLYIYDTSKNNEYMGLFGFVKNATIKNLDLTNVSVGCAYAKTAALCGYIENSAIMNCTVSGNVDNAATKSTGGLCADANSSVFIKCINYSNVLSSNEAGGVGGICGSSFGDTTFVDCANIGEVKNDRSNNLTAGIVGGQNPNLKVYDCYNYGKVSSASSSRVNAYPICDTFDTTVVSNSYYLDTSVKKEENGWYVSQSKTEAQFKSGEVAFLLNNEEYLGEQTWYQNIDNNTGITDSYPTFDKNGENAVYRYKYLDENKETAFCYTNRIIGDVDGDLKVTVLDATMIQMHAAKIIELSDLQLIVADTDRDMVVSVFDASRIQTYVARHITEL